MIILNDKDVTTNEVEFDEKELELLTKQQEETNTKNRTQLLQVFILLVLIVIFSGLCSYAWDSGAFAEWFDLLRKY